ncbi:hypothetical protein BX666DRAFT_391904 [Dichotomocladium elegans]|nr:hypothetical protein BX666DRAFT_391904 [Dichotomocladium elegans]
MELILYLEPTTKRFRDCVDAFITESSKNVPSTAMKYHCHVTMTGFFRVHSYEQLRAIIGRLEIILGAYDGAALVLSDHPAPTVGRTPILVRKKHNVPQSFAATSGDRPWSMDDIPVHLLLPVSTPPIYRTIVNQLASEFTEIRPKDINHISLAYWDEPQASEEETAAWYRAVLENRWMDTLYDLAKKTFEDCPLHTTWDIILYERVQKSSKVGVPHSAKKSDAMVRTCCLSGLTARAVS